MKKPKFRRGACRTTAEVAEKAGVAKSTIYHRALRLGLKCRPIGGVSRGEEPWWTEAEAEALVNYGKGK
jgi:hypothetical protein